MGGTVHYMVWLIFSCIHRRSAAYRELHQLEEAYMDLHDIKRKSDDDFHLIRCLELELVPFAVVQRDAPLVVTKEYR